jgi:serine phosphatase RsbU (regulator of sigma subunit)
VFRTTVLQDLTSDLSAAITADDVATTIIERGLRMVGAVAGALFVPSADGRALEVFAHFGYAPEVVEPFRRMPLDAEIPAVVAFRSRAPVVLPDVARRNGRFPDVAGNMPHDHASVALPLVAGDAVGAIGLTFGEPRTFGAEEVAFMSALADQCALALERARLHDAERRERKRSAFLAVLSGALAQSLNFERTLAKVVRLVVNGVEADGEAIAGLADRCEIDLLAQDGTIEVAAVDHRDHDVARLAREHREHHPIRRDDDGLVATVLRSGRSERIAGSREDPAGHATVMPGSAGDAPAHSSMIVALSARGRTFGAIVFAREEDGPAYTDDELSFAEQVAARASIALDNARLYRDRAEIARTLQRALKPHDPPPIVGIDLATRYLAAGEGVEVGGDFYDVWEDEGVLWVAIGDVTGKGPSAVDLNLLSRHTIRTAAMRGDDPATILRTLNRALLERGSGERFCTAMVCRFDLANKPVAGTIVSGGHPLPFVLRADGTLERAGRPGTLLGLFNEVRLEPSRLVLGAGDAMVLYTDGVIEERAGIQQFGAEGLAHELLGSVGRSAEGMAEAIEGAVRRVRPGGELLDDVALVVVRPTG